MRLYLIALAAIIYSSAPANALEVSSGSVSLDSSNPIQIGRLVRNGVPQDFSGGENFPDVNNINTPFSYTVISIPFSSSKMQDVFYDITFDDTDTDLFASAYLNSYDPTNKALNWLGDAGTSGNYFGTDALFFDVRVPQGNTLTLVVNSATGTGKTSTANYFIQAFSDSEYNENFLPVASVPEPATWAMMILGFGLAGLATRLSRRRSEAPQCRVQRLI